MVGILYHRLSQLRIEETKEITMTLHSIHYRFDRQLLLHPMELLHFLHCHLQSAYYRIRAPFGHFTFMRVRFRNISVGKLGWFGRLDDPRHRFCHEQYRIIDGHPCEDWFL